jgi:glycosyltransferase involved in cell wall biosynthesis
MSLNPEPRIPNPVRMRILHIDTGRELRGGQRQLLRLARGLRVRRRDQMIVTPEGSELEECGRSEGFQVFALPAHDWGHANGILQLRQRLLAEPADILHAHDGRGQTISWLASLGLPVRRVASRRVTFLPGAPARHRFIYTRTCHAVIAVSEHIRSLLTAAGVPAGKIHIVSDGIEIPPQLPSREERARQRGLLELKDDDFVVGHIGAFTAEKGQDLGIEAIRRVAEKLPSVRLLLGGDGSPAAMTRIREQARAMGDRVRILGNLEELTGFFAALDLFIMPSRAEGLGSAALLAMAHGEAVVASRVGGLPEVVEEDRTGWLVTPGSADALAEAILIAASDRERLRAYGEAGRERAGQFSSAIMVARTEEVYSHLLTT